MCWHREVKTVNLKKKKKSKLHGNKDTMILSG